MSDLNNNNPQAQDADDHNFDMNNNDNDDDDSQLSLCTMEGEVDPFNVDAYKILHAPGAQQCKGRNIISILDDRQMFGSAYRNKIFYTGRGEMKFKKKNVSNGGGEDGVDSNKGEGEKTGQCSTPVKNNLVQSATTTTPTNSAPQTPTNNKYSTPTRNYNNNNALGTPVNNLSTPQQQQQSQFQQPTTFNIKNIVPSSNNTKLPQEVQTINDEITSYAEYSSATKFKASYLNHLNGGLDIPKRPGMRMGGDDNDDDYYSGGRGGGMTRAQAETNRMLQEHLRQGGQHTAFLNSLNRSAGQGGAAQGGSSDDNERRREVVTLQRQLETNRRTLQYLEASLRRSQAAIVANATSQGGAGGGGAGSNNAGADRQRLQLQQQINANRRTMQQLHANLRLLQQAPNHPMNNNNPQPPNPPNNNNNNPQPSRAVSTISVAFAPNARTLASTHGDHTVKISCAHTGKLIRTLDGHPRTPWTVKYHPTNSRIVASGCLGFQVRVWDWNYQKESIRKARKMDRERKYKGRYDDVNSGVRGGPNRDWGNYQGGSKSPRSVMEARRKSHGEDNDIVSCMNIDQVCNEEDDDYASSILAELGIPYDDPAWYEGESDAYNYDDGIGVCLNMIRLNSAVISLSFHPSGEILAMASGSTLHLWDYNEEKRKRQKKALATAEAGSSSVSPSSNNNRESDARILNRMENSDFPRTQTMDFRHESALRCVHFPPCGSIIIIGGVNPASSNEGLPNTRNDPRGRRGGMSGGGMSFHLRMWEFSLDAVLDPNPVSSGSRAPRGGRINDEGILSWNYKVVKEALFNPRTVIPRVLLYNDGGFDLSQDGKVLSACADFWLPDGIDNAMDLIESRHQMDDEAPQEELSSDDDGRNNLTSSPVSGIQANNFSSPPPRSQQGQSFPDPRTPPPNFSMTLEPPSPPGKRNIPNVPRGQPMHSPHPLSIVAGDHPAHKGGGGRYVPHIVTVSLDTSPPPDGQTMLPLNPQIVRTECMRKYPNLGKVLNAAPLDGTKSSGVTCVKLSPSAEYCLLGYGVRENIPSVHEHEEERHPVTSLYNVKKGMKHVCTLTCADDDVNIARFHPESGHGFVYGTKQGRVRVLAKRPWNYYHLDD